MSCPLCGEDCTCSYVVPRADVAEAPPPPPAPEVLPDPELPGIERAAIIFAERDPAQRRLIEDPAFYRPPDDWRREVASRVSTYRARRRRDPAAASMSLDFEAPPEVVAVRERRAALTRSVAERFTHLAEPGGSVAVEEPPSNVIEFPRTVAATALAIQWMEPELAEPMVPPAPRIIDVPEPPPPEPEPLPLFAGLALPGPEHVPEPQPHVIEVPVQVASMTARVYAAVVDLLVVMVAVAIFAMVVVRGVGLLPAERATWAFALVVPAFFWALYQYLFLVHGEGTPGMSFSGLELRGFAECSVSRNARRWRALTMVISFISAGLGFVWAFADEDTLCWHDRISRTYLAFKE